MCSSAHHLPMTVAGWTVTMPMLPVVDTYIEILYGDRVNPQVISINDGRWFGLATYLPIGSCSTP
jgi:hypothetical protein